MTDLSITAASVISNTGSIVENGKAGATITAGQSVYRDSTTGRWLLTDSNSATAAARTPGGIALNGAATGQPLAVHKSGPLVVGATLTAGVAYYQSDTPGGLCPVADVGSGEYATLIGMATTTAILNVDIQASGAAL